MSMQWEQVVVDAADPAAGDVVGGGPGLGRGR